MFVYMLFRYAISNVNIRPACSLAVEFSLLVGAALAKDQDRGVEIVVVVVALGVGVGVVPLVAAGVKWWSFGAARGLCPAETLFQ